MAFQTVVGSFTLNTGTGNQTISSVGLDPTGILFYAMKVTSESALIDYSMSYGMTDGTRSKVGGVSAEDGSTNTDRIQSSTQIINLMNELDGVAEVICTIVSLGTDQFVINVGTNTSSEAILVRYIAFGGTTNLRVDEASAQASPITGVGFQGNVIIAHCMGQGSGDQGSMHAISSIMGCAERFSGSTRQWWLPDFKGENDRVNSGGQIRDDAFVGQRYNGAITWSLTLTTFDSDGFTYGGTTNADIFHYMMIELPTGIEAFATTFQKATAGGPTTQALPDATGFGNNVEAYIVATDNHLSKTTVDDSDTKISIGAYSELTSSQWVCSGTTELTAGTQADQISNNDAVLHAVTVPVSLDAIGVAQTITDSQPDIDWTTNDNNAMWIGYLAFEADPVIGGTFDQDRYRIRNDDGTDETDATWKAGLNIDVIVAKDVNIRVRFGIEETADVADPNVQFQLQYNKNSGGWNDVNGSSTNIRSSLSTKLVDAENTTEQLAMAGTFLTTNAGVDEVNGLVGGANLDFSASANEEVELEFCFQVRSADVTNGDTIQLRIVKEADELLSTYTNTPTLTVQTYTITGDVRDWGTLDTVANVRCVLLKHDGASEATRIYSVIAHVNADGSGLYAFTGMLDNDSRYCVMAYDDVATDQRGITSDDLTPASEAV